MSLYSVVLTTHPRESADVAGIASVGTAATGLLGKHDWGTLLGGGMEWQRLWGELFGMYRMYLRSVICLSDSSNIRDLCRLSFDAPNNVSFARVAAHCCSRSHLVSFAEMFYSYNVTTSQECDTSFESIPSHMREEFIIVYIMLLGTPLIDTEDDSQNSS